MTSAASRRAFEAFCSPSAAITLARASRAASASAAIARCSCTGSRTSLLQVGVHIEARSANPLEGNLGIIKIWVFTHISTLSTLTPHGSVASSRVCSMTWLIVSRSDRISARCLVPRTLRKVVAANKCVEWLWKSQEICRGCRLESIDERATCNQGLTQTRPLGTWSPRRCLWPWSDWIPDSRRQHRRLLLPSPARGPSSQRKERKK